jgi:hypothetical protein
LGEDFYGVGEDGFAAVADDFNLGFEVLGLECYFGDGDMN